MAINGVGGSYDYSAASQTSNSQSATRGSGGTQGGTATAASKFDNATDYYAYLQNAHSYLGRTANVSGVPTTVTVSESFLRQSMQDPAKAAFLEENLQAITDAVALAQSLAARGGSTLTNVSFNIDENGNISMMSSGTNDPDGRIAAENARKKAGKAEDKERAAEKRAEEKRLEEKRIEERRKERQEAGADGTDAPVNGSGDAKVEFNITVTASNVKELTVQIADSLGGPAGSQDNGSVMNIRV